MKISSQELNASLRSNPYANVLYDFIWAIALSVNGSFNILNLPLASIKLDKRSEIMDAFNSQLSILSFQGTTGFLNFSHKSAAMEMVLEVLQFQNGQPVQLIGSYHHSSNQLTLMNKQLGEIPNDELNQNLHFVLYSISSDSDHNYSLVHCFDNSFSVSLLLLLK